MSVERKQEQNVIDQETVTANSKKLKKLLL